MSKKPFVTKEKLDEIIKEYPTPFHLYDEKGRKCSGYAKIVNNSTSVAYIKCPTYKTNGYDSKYE